ncbi:L-asparagine transporter-like permease [Bacillus pakistanensis]|uniref:L-asparagine transporter-like permease n=1 Tax=Rossellomorea pakistanensis TaxID=992288 RepID=A0ABS2NHT5_9BACI|nr:amino acid permease [Bacillus pakistanensis]MBM7587384.1 L-asparagine transporter-like permease [Bacillus pakistanensis]
MNHANSPTLKRSLSLKYVVFFGLAFMAPTTLFSTYGVAVHGTNGMLSTAYIIALIVMFFTAYSYAQLVKAFPNAGAAYTFTQKSLSPHIGFLVGWTILLDYVFSPMISALLLGIAMNAYFPSIPMFIWIILFIITITIVNILGITVAAKFNTAILFLQFGTFALFIAFSIKGLLNGHGAGTLFSILPFMDSNSNMPDIMSMIPVLCFSFLGFDAVTTLSEETKNPRKSIPRAIYLITIIGGVLYIFGSYFLQLIWPDFQSFKNPESAYMEIALYIGGNFLTSYILAEGIMASFSSAVASGTSASRILYAMGAVIRHAYDFTKEQKREFFKNFLTHAASLGVTAVHDLFATESMEILNDYDLFKEFDDRGELTTRIHLWPALNGNLDHAKQLREKYQSDKLRVSGLKQFIDGVITARTAYLLEPYADLKESRGETSFPPETIKKWVMDADKEGFSIRFHAIGDGAIRLALDAYEEAQKVNGKRDSRHSIEHVEVIHPNDIPRFKELSVTASMQPDHLAMSERGVYTDRIGPEREKYVFSIHTLKKSGAKLAFGTDFPIDILNPLLQIYRAVTRIDSSGKTVWHPHEQITLAEALKAYTSGSAYGTFREQELGTLEVGKLADIAVLERNLFEGPVEEIPNTKVLLTIIDGKVVFDRKSQLIEK